MAAEDTREDVRALWELIRQTRDRDPVETWFLDRRVRDLIRYRFVPHWRFTDWLDVEFSLGFRKWEALARLAGMPPVWCHQVHRGTVLGHRGLSVMDFGGVLAMMTHWGIPIDGEPLITRLAATIPKRGGFLSLAELRVRSFAREKDRFRHIMRFRADLPGIEPETVERANGYAAAIGPGGLAIKGPRIARKDWERERMATRINPRCINLPRGVVQ